MAKRRMNPLELLDYRNLLGSTYEDDEEFEEPTDESKEVYTFIYRLLEAWRYMPIAASDGGKVVGKYITESDSKKEIAQAVIQLLELRFKVRDYYLDEPPFKRYVKEPAHDPHKES